MKTASTIFLLCLFVCTSTKMFQPISTAINVVEEESEKERNERERETNGGEEKRKKKI